MTSFLEPPPSLSPSPLKLIARLSVSDITYAAIDFPLINKATLAQQLGYHSVRSTNFVATRFEICEFDSRGVGAGDGNGNVVSANTVTDNFNNRKVGVSDFHKDLAMASLSTICATTYST
uniref:Uncharacterized protein n=1 Tax=Glossina austeni TaxID=7395 RepID=A0A1A9UVY6_GLOAU